jgi:hypothetical protein
MEVPEVVVSVKKNGAMERFTQAPLNNERKK